MQTTKEPDFNYTAVIQEGLRAATRSIEGILAGIDGLIPPDIIEWIESELRVLSVSGEMERIKLEPYQIFAIRAHLIPGCEILISMIEQSGKSTIWQLVSIYKARFMNGPSMIIYENKIKAQEINEECYKPMLLSCDYFAELEKNDPKRFLANKYKFNAGWMDIQGAGSDITSKARKYMYDDEIDTQPLTPDKQKTQCQNVRKRTRAYAKHNLHNITWCGSFKRDFNTSTMWWLAVETDLAFWHLRCQGCNDLTINSTCYEVKHISGSAPRWISVYQKCLSYEVQDNVVIEDSCRLICPECDHSHIADELPEMNKGEDQYIAKYPNRKKKVSFIVGGLGSRVNNLISLCQSHLKLRQARSPEIRRDIMNSAFGLPVDPGLVSGEAQELLDNHCVERWNTEDIDFVLMSADTQTSPFGWYYEVRAYKMHANYLSSQQITSGFCSIQRHDYTIDKEKTEEEFTKLMHESYNGHIPAFVIIDQGGTHAKIVKRICKDNKKVYQYKGEGGKSSKLTRSSKEQARLIICNHRQLSDDLRYHIYKDDNTSWFLPNDGLNPEYEQHILNVHPDTGEQIQLDNVCRKDYFDCSKMLLALENHLEKRIRKDISRTKAEYKERIEADSKENARDKGFDSLKNVANNKKKATLVDQRPNSGGWINNY